MSNTKESIEIWKDVVGYEGFYLVSNLGRIRSVDRVVLSTAGIKRKFKGVVLSQYAPMGQYYRVSLRSTKQNSIVHRLIAEAFIPNPENKSQINHKDGDKLNNHVSNLEWCTPSENIQHAFDTGLKIGKHISKKVICTKTGKVYESAKEAAKILGYKHGTLCNILNETFRPNSNKTTLRYV